MSTLRQILLLSAKEAEAEALARTKSEASKASSPWKASSPRKTSNSNKKASTGREKSGSFSSASASTASSNSTRKVLKVSKDINKKFKASSNDSVASGNNSLRKRGKRDFLKNDYVCGICEKTDNLIHCTGGCFRAFHAKCANFHGTSKQALSQWKCDQCENEMAVCYKCQKIEPLWKENKSKIAKAPIMNPIIKRCSASSCGKYYHVSCLSKIKLIRWDNDRFYCSLHSCNKCGESGKNRQSVRCLRCPIAYHQTCLPKSKVRMIMSKRMLCLEHPSLDIPSTTSTSRDKRKPNKINNNNSIIEPAGEAPSIDRRRKGSKQAVKESRYSTAPVKRKANEISKSVVDISDKKEKNKKIKLNDIGKQESVILKSNVDVVSNKNNLNRECGEIPETSIPVNKDTQHSMEADEDEMQAKLDPSVSIAIHDEEVIDKDIVRNDHLNDDTSILEITSKESSENDPEVDKDPVVLKEDILDDGNYDTSEINTLLSNHNSISSTKSTSSKSKIYEEDDTDTTSNEGSRKRRERIRPVFYNPSDNMGPVSEKKVVRNKTKKPSNKLLQPMPSQEWVSCNKCSKWRVIPLSIKSSSLPDKWFCEMNYWDSKVASCDVIENWDAALMNAPPTMKKSQSKSKDRCSLSASTKGSKRVSKPHGIKENINITDPSLLSALELLQSVSNGSSISAGVNELETNSETVAALLNFGNDPSISSANAASEVNGSIINGTVDGVATLANGHHMMPTTVAASAPAEDQWIQCDKPECRKWRTVPPYVDLDNIPDLWYCDMNDWDSSMASCSATELQYVVPTPMPGPLRSSNSLSSKSSRTKRPRNPNTSVKGSKKLSITGSALKPAADVHVEWVQCENPNCGKWRKLPSHIDPGELSEQWYCSMNIWDSSRASCGAPEEQYEVFNKKPRRQARPVSNANLWAATTSGDKNGKISYRELIFGSGNKAASSSSSSSILYEIYKDSSLFIESAKRRKKRPGMLPNAAELNGTSSIPSTIEDSIIAYTPAKLIGVDVSNSSFVFDESKRIERGDYSAACDLLNTANIIEKDEEIARTRLLDIIISKPFTAKEISLSTTKLREKESDCTDSTHYTCGNSSGSNEDNEMEVIDEHQKVPGGILGLSKAAVDTNNDVDYAAVVLKRLQRLVSDGLATKISLDGSSEVRFIAARRPMSCPVIISRPLKISKPWKKIWS